MPTRDNQDDNLQLGRQPAANVVAHTPRLVSSSSLLQSAAAATEIAILSPWLRQSAVGRVNSQVGKAFDSIAVPGPARVQFYAVDNADTAANVPANLGYWIARLYWLNAGQRDAKGLPAGSRYITPEFLANGGVVSFDLDACQIGQVGLALLNGDTATRLIHLRCEVFA